MQLNEYKYKRSRSFFGLGQRSLRYQNENLIFSGTVRSFETNVHIKPYGRMRMKIYTNEFGHMTRMAPMPIYGTGLLLQNHWTNGLGTWDVVLGTEYHQHCSNDDLELS